MWHMPFPYQPSGLSFPIWNMLAIIGPTQLCTWWFHFFLEFIL